MTRWGTYYGKTYKQYIEDCNESIPAPTRQLHGELVVNADFILPKPKKSKFSMPNGDIDNYLKAILDVLTHAGYWEDDRQVVAIHSEKFFGNEPRTAVTVREI